MSCTIVEADLLQPHILPSRSPADRRYRLQRLDYVTDNYLHDTVPTILRQA